MGITVEAKPEITSFEVDDANLIEAAKILGTRTVAETVNAALSEVVAIRKRVEAMEKLGELGARGDFDEFLDKSSYRP
ncbi:hypothetical protein Acy02nite_80830 [Actinoplanes cyaneus]|uniref:DUF2191 domain-containing protein n=1 Tax=Actinoplanes cyaneus TaxID=52696 RepID=A0A919ITI8_9ACTN|nr:DUF2191 domain-containing protein [Actinoplanes cyaneus]MCW2143352.1 hypothetical protein [Actinoplanes cyaneus]GID70202.1 hypothetical protein Acy02nite_80830 [Actinoplanes cyaneus]